MVEITCPEDIALTAAVVDGVFRNETTVFGRTYCVVFGDPTIVHEKDGSVLAMFDMNVPWIEIARAIYVNAKRQREAGNSMLDKLMSKENDLDYHNLKFYQPQSAQCVETTVHGYVYRVSFVDGAVVYRDDGTVVVTAEKMCDALKLAIVRDATARKSPNPLLSDKTKEILGLMTHDIGESSEYQPIVSFVDQSKSFVHGYEAGYLGCQMESGKLEISSDIPYHVANLELFERMCVTWNYSMDVLSKDDTYAFVKFTKRTSHFKVVK